MDYYYNNSNSGNNNTAITNNNDDSTIISYHQQQQQLQSFSYNDTHNNNNEFHDDTIQLLTSPTDEMYHRLQQPWNIHSNNSILSTTTTTNIEGSNQPERGIAGFVSKLYQCLQAPDDGHKYARWCRHNGIDMFIIDCIPKFTETVLPRLFKHCKFASFVRQLNIYGFQRDTDARKSKDSKDKETCRWHHIHFRPGRRDLFHLIRRKTPRYSRSRRKRPKTEEEEEGDLEDDPETILNTSSGDDDDLEDNNTISLDGGTQSSGFDDNRHRSASLVSSPILYQQQPQIHHTNNINLDYKSRQLQMIYESPQEVDSYLQINTQPQQSSSTASSPQYCQSLPNNNNVKSIIPLPMTATYNGSEVEDPNDLYLMQQHHHQTATIDQSPQNNQVEHLQAEIEQLRKGYLKMYKILSGEVNKAVNLIGVQRSRIEYLENTLRSNSNNQQHHQQQQLRLRQQQQQQQQVLPFIDTTLTNNNSTNNNYFTNHNNNNENNNNNNNILYHHPHSTNTTPTTPIYPQTVTNPIHRQQHIVHSSPSGSNSVLHEGYDFLFSHNNDNNRPTTNNSSNNAIEEELKLSVASTDDDKWISTPLIQHNIHL